MAFLVAAPSAVLYSQGYRLDLKELRIVQTGSFYFRVVPRSVNIEISPERDGATLLQRSTDFLFGTSYVENMVPGSYNVIVSKENHHPWRKRLEIRERRVTEMKNIVLIPNDPGFSVIGESVSALFPVPNDPRIAIKEFAGDDEWTLSMRDPVRNRSIHLISSEETTGDPVELASSPGRREIIIDMGDHHLIIDPANGLKYEIEGLVSPILDPSRPNSVIRLENGDLVSNNYVEGIVSLLASDIRAFNIRENGDIVWLSDSGSLFENGGPVRNGNFAVKENADYRIFLPNQSEIIIAENDTFHLLDRSVSAFREIFRSHRDPVVSPDRRKIAYFGNHEISVLYLDDIADQPAKSYGESSFLTRFSGTIGDVGWFTNHYMIFNVGDEIKVIEIDDRDHINIVDLMSLPSPDIHFERSDKRLYVISNGDLFVSTILIP